MLTPPQHEHPTDRHALLSPLERREFDYAGLEEALAFAEETIRRTRRNLAMLHSSRSAQITQEAFDSAGRLASQGEPPASAAKG